LPQVPISLLETRFCDPGQGRLRRYAGYSIRADHADTDSHAELTALPNPAEEALLAHWIAGCRFDYVAGTASRNGVVSIRLEVSHEGERVVLLQQVQVVNAP